MNFLKKNIKWVCHHAHLDKSNIINKDLLIQSDRHMRDKWYTMDTIKKKYTRHDLSHRIGQSILKIVSQNCKHIRTFVDIEDAMEAYWLAAKKGKIGEIYNIGGNKIISVRNFLKELMKLSNKKIITKLDPNLLRPQDVALQIPSSKKFIKDTGWKPKVSFEKSVKKLLEECRKYF